MLVSDPKNRFGIRKWKLCAVTNIGVNARLHLRYWLRDRIRRRYEIDSEPTGVAAETVASVAGHHLRMRKILRTEQYESTKEQANDRHEPHLGPE